MNPYKAYHLYLSLKRHFTSLDYDAIKYNFKTNASVRSFEKRRDKHYFTKLSKHQDPGGLLVSNFIHDDITWIGDLFDHRAEKIYSDWLKRKQSLSYLFKTEIADISNYDLLVKNGDYPPLYRKYRTGKVSLETIVLLNSFLKFLPYWDKKIDDSILWPKDSLVILKYRPFIKVDTEKFKSVIQERINNES